MTDFHAVTEEEHEASVRSELAKLRKELDGNRGGHMPRRHHHAKDLYEYLLFLVGWDARQARPYTRDECVEIEEFCGRYGTTGAYLRLERMKLSKNLSNNRNMVTGRKEKKADGR